MPLRSMADVEQVGVLARRCAQILIRRPHARAEMSSRVPGPTRIEKDRARESDQIGLSGRDDGFCLFELRDEPDRNHGYAHSRLDSARERDLITRTHRDALGRVEAATGDVN